MEDVIIYCYRNIAWKYSNVDVNYDRDLCLEELEPEEYIVLESIAATIWKCELDVIKHLRANSSFFNFISDKRIKEILGELTRQEKLSRRAVLTDVELNPTQKTESFVADTEDFRKAI